VKFLLDVNISPLWIDFLQSAGYDAVHWTSVGDARARDEEIAAYAVANGFVVFTRDLDFGALLARTRALAPSVILLRGEAQLPARIGLKVIRILQLAADSLESGALISTDVSTTRLVVLPIRQ
jgi:predicted nuclease of predicted toxin-antitoxin system